MLAKENSEVIDGRRQFISVDVLDSEEAADDAYIDHYGNALYEEGCSSLLGAVVTEEVGDMQKALKYSPLSSYMLKPSHLLTQGFGDNRTT